MTSDEDDPTVVAFPNKKKISGSSTQRIWGKKVCEHGYAAIPSILIKAQKRLSIRPTEMNILIQLLDHWIDPARPPFPTKRQLAERMGITEKTLQNNMNSLEKKELVKRERRKTAAGDWTSNIYHLDGLVEKVQALEPDFTETRRKKKAMQEAAEGRYKGT